MILVHEGKLPENAPRWNGQCRKCSAVVECLESEAKYSSNEYLYVSCPTKNCGDIIILQEGKWMGTWIDPIFKQKDWYITPTVPEDLEKQENK